MPWAPNTDLTSNGDVSIWVKDSRPGCKTENDQSILNFTKPYKEGYKVIYYFSEKCRCLIERQTGYELYGMSNVATFDLFHLYLIIFLSVFSICILYFPFVFYKTLWHLTPDVTQVRTFANHFLKDARILFL
jgi:hypothetical protein